MDIHFVIKDAIPKMVDWIIFPIGCTMVVIIADSVETLDEYMEALLPPLPPLPLLLLPLEEEEDANDFDSGSMEDNL